MTINPPPPSPQLAGLTTESANEVATAASTAFPPCFRMLAPAALAAHPFNLEPVGTGPFVVDSDSWTRTGRLRLRPRRGDWSIDASPLKVNAFYTFEKNIVVVPAAILSPPLFSLAMPGYSSPSSPEPAEALRLTAD